MKKFKELLIAVFLYISTGVVLVLKQHWSQMDPLGFEWMYILVFSFLLLAFGFLVKWIYLRFKLNNCK